MKGGRVVWGFVALLLALPALADCSKDEGETLPPPLPFSTTTTRIDFSQVALPTISPGKPLPTTRPRGPGQASIAGRVVDDLGAPVPMALVRAAYFADPNKPEVVEALSGEDGSYRFDQLFGGRWRIRAWKAPLLATLEVPAFFLGAREQKTLNLKVKAVPGLGVTAKMAPDPPLMGSPAELAVLVVTQTVDAEGAVVRTVAPDTAVSLSFTGFWSLQADSAQLTGDDGTARWTLTCLEPGNQPISAVVSDQEFPLSLPACLDPASTTTTAPPESSSTSSTRPRPRATTTTRPKTSSTTRPAIRPN